MHTTVDNVFDGGTISGNVTISGNFTVTGTTTTVVNEVLSGTLTISVDNAAAMVVETSGNVDVLNVDTNTPLVTVTGGSLIGANAAAYSLMDEAATYTNPTLVPRRSAAGTGLGSGHDSGMSLIVAGQELFRLWGDVGGTPGVAFGGSPVGIVGTTFTDSVTAGSGTATAFANFTIAAPTLAATNASVTTTDFATFYVAGPVTAGTNQTITNNWALWVDSGDVRLDGIIRFNGTMGNSALSPTTDAPADWVEAEIGGTTYYIPAYAAS